ncbi:hypothetical protein B296_00014643 [Ensete ventricosum]|uniref:Uncharacterized protein n=1 Tax=Ensete ventricosum TaxID=4639 RepID=A0A427AQK8_ENSVE|nr:hypothetical protein B296_00014643 [Ensete ventricosum]
MLATRQVGGSRRTSMAMVVELSIAIEAVALHVGLARVEAGQRPTSCWLQLSVVVDVKKVWEVQIRKIDPSPSGSKALLSTSKVTLLCYRQAPNAVNDYAETIKKYAKL